MKHWSGRKFRKLRWILECVKARLIMLQIMRDISVMMTKGVALEIAHYKEEERFCWCLKQNPL